MKKHRGLSAVVGAVFLVAVVISALSYVTYSMNVLGNFSESLITEEKRQKDKQGEEFEITSIDITSANKLDGIVTNTGQVPLEIKSLWIEEVGAPNSVKKFDIGKTVAPGDQLDLINSVNFVMDPTKGYTMKMVSGRGEVQTFHVNSVSSDNLYLQTHALPAVISTEFDTVVLMTVTNNATNSATILNLTPNPFPTVDTSSCLPNCLATYVSGPTPSSYPSLKSGEAATFKWVYTIAGKDSNTIKFTTSILNGITTNTASANGEVRDIVSALESGTALNTLGLQTVTGSKDILYLHDENWFTPNGEYQLQTSTPDLGGDFVDIDNENPTWITNNGTDTVVLPAGIWTASLNYITEFLPDTLVQSGNNQVDMIFHLNKNIDTEPDSSGNTIGLDRCNSPSAPQYFSSGGPDNSPYYHFDGSNDCFTSNFSIDTNTFANIQSSPDTTAFWFKANNLSVNRAIMFRVDESITDYSKSFYQISLGDGNSGSVGKIVFEFDTNNGGSRTKCISTARWDNNVWHHVVAVRNASNQCKLYMDGNSTPVATDTHSYATSTIIGKSKFKIGYNGIGEYFTGDIDQIFHWNDKALSTSEISSLYNAKYGDTATTINFSIYKTDYLGNNIGSPIKQSLNYPIKFADSGKLDDSNSYNSLADSIWNQMNYTTGSISEVTLDPTQRLNFTMAYVSGLDMILRHDDNTMISPKSSYLQTTTPTTLFPAYFTYDKSNRLQVIAHNSGPYGSWFVYQGTRAIFDSLSSTTSYAAIICSVNSTQSDQCVGNANNDNWLVTENRDSIFIPINSNVNLYFWSIQDRPDRDITGGTVIPAGNYHMYVFIDGYDETGKSFLRQMDIGNVKVVD